MKPGTGRDCNIQLHRDPMSNMNNLRQEGGLPGGVCALPLALEGGRALATRVLLLRFSVYNEHSSHACWPKLYHKARGESGGIIHFVSCSLADPFFKYAVKKSSFLKKLLLIKSVSYRALGVSCRHSRLTGVWGVCCVPFANTLHWKRTAPQPRASCHGRRDRHG